ncbi:MAG: helix-turn-helix domain-containing protein [Tannerellaceae bacterium]|jgi:excisionase family DNA binding protein|nr:helix-turn-helix domain-containing protein [Tannerellaceae bacterium]
MKQLLIRDILPKEQELWTYDDVQRKLGGISRDFIDKRIHRGEIRVVKIGKKNRFIPSDIEAYIAKNV